MVGESMCVREKSREEEILVFPLLETPKPQQQEIETGPHLD